jgi:hypothetical protein
MLTDLFYILPVLWEHMLKISGNPGAWKIWLYEHRHFNALNFPAVVKVHGGCFHN